MAIPKVLHRHVQQTDRMLVMLDTAAYSPVPAWSCDFQQPRKLEAEPITVKPIALETLEMKFQALLYCRFFAGLGSALSWLARADPDQIEVPAGLGM